MPNYERNLRQICTFWQKTGTDQYGKPTFAAPVVLNCRWEDINEKVIDKHGSEIVSKSRIFTAAQLSPEGYLAPGSYASEPNPLDIPVAEEIRQHKIVPDLRNLKNLYTTWL